MSVTQRSSGESGLNCRWSLLGVTMMASPLRARGLRYVGVGIVQSAVEPASSFTINTDDGEKRAMDVLKYSDLYHRNADDPDKSEFFVPVKWLETRSEQDAVNEVGFFGNQNTVCKPTTPKWRHTVEKLKLYFKSWDIQV